MAWRMVGLHRGKVRASYTGSLEDIRDRIQQGTWGVIYGYGPSGEVPMVSNDDGELLEEAMQVLVAHTGDDKFVLTAEGKQWACDHGLMVREIGPRKTPRVKLAQEFVREIDPAELALRAWNATQDMCK